MNGFHRYLLLLFSSLILSTAALAQDIKPLNAGAVLHELRKIPICESVLYVAAHPDDENTRLISTLAKEYGYRVAYLSLTRGDGGQNLIGSEIYEDLGIIRTEELISARKTDGAEQYFTRAYDFGYSKTADETLKKWNKEKVLEDMVLVIRTLQPKYIITRFPPDNRAGHGHHTVSALLADEAMDLAADPKAYTHQLKKQKPWQVERLYFNASTFFSPDLEAYFIKEGIPNAHWTKIDVGGYNSLLGLSYAEISAYSRSLHRSQGFGSAPSRGSKYEYLQWKKGTEPVADESFLKSGIKTPLFTTKNVETEWRNLTKPLFLASSVDYAQYSAALIKLYKLLDEYGVKDDAAVAYKKGKITNLLANFAGVFAEIRAVKPYAAPGDSVKLEINWVSRLSDATLNSIEWSAVGLKMSGDYKSSINHVYRLDTVLVIGNKTNWPAQHWLRKPQKDNLFSFEDESMAILPNSEFPESARVSFTYNGLQLHADIPVTYHFVDPAQGEIQRLFRVLPPLSLQLPETPIVLKADESTTVSATVMALKKLKGVTVFVETPEGIFADPSRFSIDSMEENAVFPIQFKIKGVKGSNAEGLIKLVAQTQGQKQGYRWAVKELNYPHISHQYLMKPAEQKILRMAISTPPLRIGYINGAGDAIPDALAALGYNAEIIKPTDINPEYLSKFQTIVMGIRAFNAVPEVEAAKEKLFQWVENGGTLLVQYHTSRGLDSLAISPVPLQLSRVRVTEEDAEMKVLNPNAPVFNYPNKITGNDFSAWVQERGLYYASSWDKSFSAPLSSHDTGEKEQLGGLLIAPYGKGHYIYTGLAFFRQLPAGVPGAYSLFVNLLHTGYGQGE